MDTEIKMNFTFGALEEIKEATGVDLFDQSEKNKAKEIQPDQFKRVAQAGIRWSKPGVTDDEAAELSNYISMGQVLTALRESFKTPDDDLLPIDQD